MSLAVDHSIPYKGTSQLYNLFNRANSKVHLCMLKSGFERPGSNKYPSSQGAKTPSVTTLIMTPLGHKSGNTYISAECRYFDVMMCAVMLNVILLNVVAPYRGLYYKTYYGLNLRISVIS